MRRLLPLLLVPLLAGCDLIERPPLSEAFGAPYDLVVGAPATTGGHAVTPLVSDEGALVVVVAFRGGCHDHHFRLQYTIADAVARLWIVHEDFEDACGERQQEELTFPLNPTVLAQPTLELLRPDGGALALRSPAEPSDR